MEITILGSGGNSPTPKPTCGCRVCEEAREKGIPYERNGNSLFVHDENVLIDTPEMIWQSLNRERIAQVEYVLLTHFHADHWMGLRVLQALAAEEPPVESFVGSETPTLLVNRGTYENVLEANEFPRMLADHWADVEILEDGETREIGSLELRHLEADMDAAGRNSVSNYLFTKDGRNVLVSSDENTYLDPAAVPDLDLWIKETGYFAEDPNGNPLVTDTAVETTISDENTFENTIQQVRAVGPERAVLTEIEELYRRSYDDYLELEAEYADLNVEFAYDGMRIEV